MISSSGQLRVKTKLGGEIRRFSVPRERLSFGWLVGEIRRVHKLHPKQNLGLTKLRGSEVFDASKLSEVLECEYPQLALSIELKKELDSVEVKDEQAKAVEECYLCDWRRTVPRPWPKTTKKKDGKLPPVIKYVKTDRYTSPGDPSRDEEKWTPVQYDRRDIPISKNKNLKINRSRVVLPQVPKSIAQKYKNEIVLYVNGQRLEITDAAPDARLGRYLRNRGFTGVKLGCEEGGCGACTVVLSYPDSKTGETIHKSTNACMRLLNSCDGMEVTNAAGIGNQRDGFHAIQTRLAEEHGTQCGYCTVGWVAQMYAVLMKNPEPTVEDIENSFAGNLCRCTGYRPILSAFHSFGSDGDKSKIEKFNFDAKAEAQQLMSPKLQTYQQNPFYFRNDEVAFFRPLELADVFVLLREYADVPTRLVVGNTSSGVAKYFGFVPDDDPQVYIDISSIPELNMKDVDDTGITLGAAISISDLQEMLVENQDRSTTFRRLAEHILDVSGFQVRNTGSWAGNMVLGQTHPGFPSDLVLLFSAIGAFLTISSQDTPDVRVSVQQFISLGVPSGSVIKNIFIPFAGDNVRFDSFKVMHRPQNSKSIVNAAFHLTVDPVLNTISDSVLVFGGTNPRTFFATRTSDFLQGLNLSPSTLQGALEVLDTEIQPSLDSQYSVDYRKSLTQTLFYKFFLRQQDDLPARLVSGALPYQRPVSSGLAVYPAPADTSPVGDPVPHITAQIQTSGEAMYTDDYPNPTTGRFAAPVLSTRAKGAILSIDASPALALPGVVDFISAGDIEDIGGTNDIGQFPGDMEVFASTEVSTIGQVLGMICAESIELAERASLLVDVIYGEPDSEPVLTIAQAIEHESFFGSPNVVTKGDVEVGFEDADFILEGEMNQGSQHHFYMETQSAFVSPDENDGIKITCSTQDPAGVVNNLALALGMPDHKIICETKRAGGGYGGKAPWGSVFATWVAVCARVLQRPVRCQLRRETDFLCIGKRHPWFAKYRVGYQESGRIVAVDIEAYAGGGCTYTDTPADTGRLVNTLDNAYHIPNMKATIYACNTNLPSNTWVRSPGTINGVFYMEYIMEHVAKHSGMDPVLIREQNFLQDGDTLLSGTTIFNSTMNEVWDLMRRNSDIENTIRETEEFNQNNRWRKRGLSIMPTRHRLAASGKKATCVINVQVGDGSLLVTTSGAEMGQGLHTKVAQAVAYGLNIPMDLVHIGDNSTRVIPTGSSGSTSGSSTSEAAVQAALNACEKLNEILEPYREQNPTGTWRDIIRAASSSEHLSVSGTFGFCNDPQYTYFIWLASFSLVEIDVLTGEITVLRTDMVYDAGQPLNPLIDLGQIEGSFVMGMGMVTYEEVIEDTVGELTTWGTFQYKPPCSKSIPIQFNVAFLDREHHNTGVLSSKATGEPAVDSGPSVFFAIKSAIASAREEIDGETCFDLDSPATVERTQRYCNVSRDQLTF